MKIRFFYLLLIIILAGVLRLYRLDLVPPSLSWDEVDVGYNAYTIANWRYDEWGKFMPVVFKSFEDDKNPAHIYFTALSVRILGTSDFSVRLPAALFGIFNVIMVCFLTQELFKKNYLSLLAALFLAVSPYSLQFSRFNHEANFALFFMMAGLYLFIKGLQNGFLLPMSYLSFGISLLSYHSSKVIVPVIILLLFGLYHKSIWRLKFYFFIAVIILTTFGVVFFYNPALSGSARISQTAISGQNLPGKYFAAYLSHFSWKYLFESGDSNVRHSVQAVGEFYKIEVILLIVGILGLVLRRSKESLIILTWFFIAPIPASIAQETPHAARSLFMMGSGQIISAYGFYQLLVYFKNKKMQLIITAIILITLLYQFTNYLNYYYNLYPIKSATDWQYGMKQIAEYINKNEKYLQVFITEERHQPYAFMLYFLKTPLPDFISTVQYNTHENRSYNLVSGYSKFQFGGWDKIQSMPDKGRLYVLTPSEYDGLAHKNDFQIKKLIKYPDGSGAFVIVSVN